MSLTDDFFFRVSRFANLFEQMAKAVDKMEPEQLQKSINQNLNCLCGFIKEFENKYSSEDLSAIKNEFHKQIGTWQWLMSSKINRKIYEKSFGYSGDFEVIDLIYRAVSDSPGIGYFFDEYLYNTPACQAVRNRKDFVVSLVCAEIQRISDAVPKIFNLGSGPGRDYERTYREE